MSTERLHFSATGVLASVAGLGFLTLLVHEFLDSNTARTTSIQPIALLAPPPAPALPPEIKRPVIEPPHRDQPLDMSDLNPGVAGADPGPAEHAGPAGPAAGALSLNEAGTSGTDAFGLGGNPGGRELLLTGGGGGGNPNARFLQFASQLQQHVEAQLNELPELKRSCYTVAVEIRVAAGGSMENVRIHTSSGDPALDSRIRTALAQIAPISAVPPSDMPWPVGLKLISHGADCQPRDTTAAHPILR